MSLPKSPFSGRACSWDAAEEWGTLIPMFAHNAGGGNFRTALLGIVLVSTAALVGTGVGGLVFGGLGEFQQRIMWAAVVGALFGSAGLLATVRFSQGWLPRLFPVGFAVSCAASLLALALIWGYSGPGGVAWRLATTAAVVGVTVSHVAFFATFPSRRTWVWACRSVAMLIAIGVGFLVTGALWGGGPGGASSVYYVWLTAALVFDVFGTVGVILLSRRFGELRPQRAARETVGRFRETRGSAGEPGPSF